MKGRKIAVFLGILGVLFVGVLLGLAANSIYAIATSLIGGRNIQTLGTASERHTAKLLKKHNLADINFIVKVDGVHVYESYDLMPFPDHIYRETLLWDKSETVVVLELMGRRIFAYNADEKREMVKGELANYEFYPTLADHYFYAELVDVEN